MATARKPSLADYERTLRAALLSEKMHVRLVESDEYAAGLYEDTPEPGHLTIAAGTLSVAGGGGLHAMGHEQVRTSWV